jgi:hypothetical protein
MTRRTCAVLVAVLLAVWAGCGPPAVQIPTKPAPPPTEPGTFVDRPNLNR